MRSEIAGVDHVGLGADMYPRIPSPVGIWRRHDYPNITRGLKKRGYDDEAIKKIMGGNFLRVWKKQRLPIRADKFSTLTFSVQKLPGHKSIKTTEIYSYLCNKNLYSVICMLPNPYLGTPYTLDGDQIAQVIEKKVVGDTGFERKTSTVW